MLCQNKCHLLVVSGQRVQDIAGCRDCQHDAVTLVASARQHCRASGGLETALLKRLKHSRVAACILALEVAEQPARRARERLSPLCRPDCRAPARGRPETSDARAHRRRPGPHSRPTRRDRGWRQWCVSRVRAARPDGETLRLCRAALRRARSRHRAFARCQAPAFCRALGRGNPRRRSISESLVSCRAAAHRSRRGWAANRMHGPLWTRACRLTSYSPCWSRSRGTCSTTRCGPSGRRTWRTRPRLPTR